MPPRQLQQDTVLKKSTRDGTLLYIPNLAPLLPWLREPLGCQGRSSSVDRSVSLGIGWEVPSGCQLSKNEPFLCHSPVMPDLTLPAEAAGS